MNIGCLEQARWSENGKEWEVATKYLSKQWMSYDTYSSPQ